MISCCLHKCNKYCMEMMHKNVELNQKVITFEEFKLSNALKRQIISALSLSLCRFSFDG